MERSIVGRVVAGAMVAASILAGTLIVDASAGSGGIAEPQVLELLNTLGCREPGDCPHYRLTDTTGERPGSLRRSKDPLVDADGNEVGFSSLECFAARGQRTMCSQVIVLGSGPYTEGGTIVTQGLLGGLPARFAVTGGTGAYEGVDGQLTATSDPDGIRLRLHLVP